MPTEPTSSDIILAGLRAREAVKAMARQARNDPAFFTEYIYRDNEGRSITMADMHVGWHSILTMYDRAVIWSHMEAGKTTQVSVCRVLYEIGLNPNIRVLILSATMKLAGQIAAEIATNIERNPRLHQVFPDMVPTKLTTEPWQPLAGRLTVKRTQIMKDPTITIAGIGSAILGARFDLVILDDVLDPKNTATAAQRKHVIAWLSTAAQSRLTAKGRFWVIGTAFHPDDALHYYGKVFTQSTGEQRAWRYPVVDQLGNSRWPEAWPPERIARKRSELLPAEFARSYLCEARDDADSLFKREWIEVAVRKGANIKPQNRLERFPPGCQTITGVDLAVGREKHHDLTCFFTIMLHANKDIEVLEVKTGRYEGQDLINALGDVMRRWGSAAFVENNAAQEYLVHFMKQQLDGHIQGLTTGRNKTHPEFGIQRIATELYQGKWIIPSFGGIAPEMQEWINEMLYHDPSTHTGDRLMGAFLARQGVDMGERRAEVGYLPNVSQRR